MKTYKITFSDFRGLIDSIFIDAINKSEARKIVKARIKAQDTFYYGGIKSYYKGFKFNITTI